MTIRRYLLAGCFAGLGAVLLVAAAVAGTTSTQQAASQSGSTVSRGGTLRLNISASDYEYLDPALSYDANGWATIYAVNTQLLNYPDKPGAEAARLVPEVAVAIPRPTGGGKIYTFRVRPGFRFSDGSAVTAQSFARAVERALDPAMLSPAASFLGDVVGVATVQAGKAKRPSGVTVSGNTITFRLTEPRADFLSRDRDAVLLRRARRASGRPEGCQHTAGAGPYYVAASSPTRRDRAAQPVLRRQPAAALGRDPRHPERRRESELPSGPERTGRPRSRRVARRRATAS